MSPTIRPTFLLKVPHQSDAQPQPTLKPVIAKVSKRPKTKAKKSKPNKLVNSKNPKRKCKGKKTTKSGYVTALFAFFEISPKMAHLFTLITN